MQTIDVLLADQQALLRSGLRFIHFFALCIGLGTATLLDMLIIRFFRSGTVSTQLLTFFTFGTHILTFGLFLLWASGVGFLAYYWHYSPELLANPKIHAKIAIVGILTLNGLILHLTVLPMLRRQEGKQLMEGLSRDQKQLMCATGITSGVSWYAPLVIANLPQLNFVVPMQEILTIYAIVLCGLLLASYFILIVSHTPETIVADEEVSKS